MRKYSSREEEKIISLHILRVKYIFMRFGIPRVIGESGYCSLIPIQGHQPTSTRRLKKK